MDAQLSIAKAFTLPVRAEAKNTCRKASSGHGSSASSSAYTSGFRGRGRGSDSGGSKRKASSLGRYQSKKSPLLPSGEEAASEARVFAQRS